MDQKKEIILCADDYGLNPNVSQGIRELVQLNRLSAISCIVNLPNMKAESQMLLQLKSPISIGIHFNLTECPAGFNFNTLLLKSHLGLLSKKHIQIEFEKQLNQFTEYFNQLPDFIDGHEHVHQFPIIRNAILEHYQMRFPRLQIPIRSTYPCIMIAPYRFKSWVIQNTGGKALKKRLQQLNIPHFPNFAGVYHFLPSTNYRMLFRKWLKHSLDKTLIMCHPGRYFDPFNSREMEWRYFSSDLFLEDLQEHESKLASSSMI